MGNRVFVSTVRNYRGNYDSTRYGVTGRCDTTGIYSRFCHAGLGILVINGVGQRLSLILVGKVA